MLRGLVTGFKKPGPVTSYTSFSAYSIEDTWRQTYESQEEVDVMMVEGQKQTVTQGGTTISESYMAGGRGYDEGSSHGGGEVLVVFQTNANADLLAYVIKSRDELGADWHTYRDAFMGGMTDAIWNTMQGWFTTTLTVSTSSGTITISDGGQSILVNASTHAMRYNVDYYDWSSDTSTEYSTLQTNGWLVDGTYTYQGVNQDWNNLITSLKAKGVVNATITHDTVNGEITMANGQWSMTIMDKNLGATEYLGQTPNNDALAYGDYYCWGGKTPFVTLPTNPNEEDWQQVQTIAPAGYHIPTADEQKALVDMFTTVRPNAHSGDDFKNTFKMPFAGYRDSSANVIYQGAKGEYWSSTPSSANRANYLYTDSSDIFTYYTNLRESGLPVRCFKNTYTLIPINQLWSTFGDTTDIQNEMNSHPYDYYLLGGCTTPLTLASGAGAMRRVYASYDTNTNTWSVMEVS